MASSVQGEENLDVNPLKKGTKVLVKDIKRFDCNLTNKTKNYENKGFFSS